MAPANQRPLAKEVRVWPTPTLHGNYTRKGLSKKSGDGLETAVKMWPTPTTRKHKGERSQKAMKKWGRNPMTNTLSDAEEAQSDNQPPKGRLVAPLNPTGPRRAVGFPIGWT